jgi:hypothetical protein
VHGLRCRLRRGLGPGAAPCEAAEVAPLVALGVHGVLPATSCGPGNVKRRRSSNVCPSAHSSA